MTTARDGKYEFKASVVVPAYNSEDYIIQSLDSIAAQSVPPLEIVVVDDGSQDNTSNVVRAWLERVAVPVRLIEQVNGGAAAARNRGLREASGDWVCFLDSDDLYEPNALESFAYALSSFPDAQWIGGDIMSVSEDLQRTLIGSFRNRRGAARYLISAFESGESIRLERPWREFLAVCLTAMGAVAARRDLLLSHGGFREELKIAEDYQLWIRLAREMDFVFVPRLICRYRERKGSLMNSGQPPRVWTRKAFRELASLYGFDTGETIYHRRMQAFAAEDAAHFEAQGEFGKAMSCRWQVVRGEPASLAAWWSCVLSPIRATLKRLQTR